jgi:CBS domain-containing protein
VNGKAEWLAYGLPVQGERSDEPRAGDYAHDDVVTCALGDPVGTVLDRVEESPYGFALVVSGSGVLLGRLRRKSLEGDPGVAAKAVMEAGPSTVRPDLAPGKLAKSLRERDLKTAIVTTPDGRLVGVVRARDLP